MITALFIKGNILLAAVQNDLVAPPLFPDLGQHLNDALPQTLSLTIFMNDNVLDVTAQSTASQELEFDKERPARDDLVRGSVDEYDGVVGVGRGLLECELLGPCGGANIGGRGEVGEHSEMAAVVVVASEWANDDVLW